MRDTDAMQQRNVSTSLRQWSGEFNVAFEPVSAIR